MIIRARHNFLIYSFFRLYTILKIRRNFHSVTISGETGDRGLPILIVSNHTSWWDGFWVMYANMKLFRRKFHFMMLEEQLDKFWFFKYSGGFSVRKGSRSVFETLDHAAELLTDNRNMVLVFPQGEIQSVYRTGFSFEKGIGKILKAYDGNYMVLLNANLIDYHSHQKPSLYIFLKVFTPVEKTAGELEREYNSFHLACISELVKRSSVG